MDSNPIDVSLADRELIDACAKFIFYEDQYSALANTPDGTRLDETRKQIDDALAWICDTPAITPAGIKAKARALHFQIRKYVLPENTQPEDDLAWSLVNDIVGRE